MAVEMSLICAGCGWPNCWAGSVVGDETTVQRSQRQPVSGGNLVRLEPGGTRRPGPGHGSQSPRSCRHGVGLADQRTLEPLCLFEWFRRSSGGVQRDAPCPWQWKVNRQRGGLGKNRAMQGVGCFPRSRRILAGVQLDRQDLWGKSLKAQLSSQEMKK